MSLDWPNLRLNGQVIDGYEGAAELLGYLNNGLTGQFTLDLTAFYFQLFPPLWSLLRTSLRRTAEFPDGHCGIGAHVYGHRADLPRDTPRHRVSDARGALVRDKFPSLGHVES